MKHIEMKKYIIPGIMLLLGVSVLWAAEETAVNDIADITLEDLLNTKVTVAGKTEQKINEAPAIISVLTDQDIYDMGATNLNEVLSYIPGINITETYFAFSDVNIRGTLQTHYNNKTLVLLNNHPMFDTNLGTFYLEQIPINMIKRIEIIRGPGSTLYGTNAYAGVIKIITYDGADIDGLNIGVSGGSFKTINPGIIYGKKFEKFSLAAGGNFFDTKGYPYHITADEEGKSGTLNLFNDHYSGLITLNAKNLSVNLGYVHMKKNKLGMLATLVSTGERTLNGLLGDISYTFKIDKKTDLAIYAYADTRKKNEVIDWYPPYQAMKDLGIGGKEEEKNTSSKYGIDLQGFHNFSNATRLIGGLVYEYQYTSPQIFYIYGTDIISPLRSSAILQKHSTVNLSAYTQLDTRISKTIGLVGGLRYTYNKNYGSKVVPRGGIILNATDRISFKVLYGQAFRSPSFFEKYVETFNVIYGNETLKPEQINTLDIGFDYLITPKNSIRINFFHTTTDNLITRSTIVKVGERGNTKDTPGYANSDGQRFNGVEAELKGQHSKNFQYFINASYVKGKLKQDDSTIGFVPEFSSNLGMTWLPFKKTRLSAYLQFVGDRKGTLADNRPSTTESYTLFNMTLSLQPVKNITIQLIGKNLGNKTYYVPEYIRRVIPELPGGPERAFYLRLDYHL